MNTVAAVAKSAGVHPSTITRWIQAGTFGEVQKFNGSHVLTAETAAKIIEYAAANVKRRMVPESVKSPPAAATRRKWRNIGEMIAATQAGQVKPVYIGAAVPEGVEG